MTPYNKTKSTAKHYLVAVASPSKPIVVELFSVEALLFPGPTLVLCITFPHLRGWVPRIARIIKLLFKYL